MTADRPPPSDPRELGRRLQEARKARGHTQEAAAEHLGVARTTITAIEKGQRRIQPAELARLARFYGRGVGEFLRQGEPVEAFAVQLRATLGSNVDVEKEIAPCTWEFQRLCEDYLELERLCQVQLSRRDPPTYRVEGVAPEVAAEDIASAERNRLGLGDGPLLELRELLERDVGLRIFFMELPSRIAAMFAYTEHLGGCIAVNRKHPPERQRNSLAHEYLHFLTRRYRPEIAVVGRHQRQPEHERLADTFARAFLLPATGLSRRFHELKRGRDGQLTPADLCALAHFYFVSVQALTLRLEELRLLPAGVWDRLVLAGFRVHEARALLRLEPRHLGDHLLPVRYQYLAAEAFDRGELSEGQLARFLRVDRVEARELVARLAASSVVSDEGASETLPLSLGGPLPLRGE